MARPKRYRITPEQTKTICAYVRAGGFPHVAAEAAGVPRDVFAIWLEYGEKPGRAYAPYRALRDHIMQATATARLNAEIKVLQDDPSKWLQSGPGRETGDSPGWTVPVKPIIRENNQTINILTNPQMQTLFGAVLQMLEPFPEARAAVSQALAGRPAIDHKP